MKLDEVVDAYWQSGKDLEFIPDSHTYLYDGKAIPSVTQCLSIITDKQYTGLSSHYRMNAALVGTIVHEVTARIDSGKDVDVERLAYELLIAEKYISSDSSNDEIEYYMDMLCNDIEQYRTAYKDVIRAWNIEIGGVEIMVCTNNPKMLYAGTIDRIASVRNEPAILDIKTSSKISPLAPLQLHGYGMCVAELRKHIKYGVIHLENIGDRKNKKIRGTLQMYQYDEYCEKLVESAYHIYNFMADRDMV